MEQVVVKATNSIHKVEIVKTVDGLKNVYMVRNVKKKSSGRGRSGVSIHTTPNEAMHDFRSKVSHRSSSDKESMKLVWPNGKKNFKEFTND